MEWQSKQPWHSSNLSTISRKASHHLRVAGGCWPMTGGLVYVTSASGCHQSARSSVHGSCIASHHRFLTCGHSARGSQGPDHACARSTFPHLPCPRGAVGRRVCFRPQPREDTGLCAWRKWFDNALHSKLNVGNNRIGAAGARSLAGVAGAELCTQ